MVTGWWADGPRLLPLLWCDGATECLPGAWWRPGEVSPARRAVSDSPAGPRCVRGGPIRRACPALMWSLVLRVLCLVCPGRRAGDVLRSLGPPQLSREDWDKPRAEGSADASCGSWGTRTPHHSSIALPRPAGWGVCKHVHVCHAGLGACVESMVGVEAQFACGLGPLAQPTR